MKYYKKISIAIVLTISAFTFSGCFTPAYVTTSVQYSNPEWAPPYYTGVRYYYLPDIEAYYDLSNRNFAYMNNGIWMFGPTLPGMYSSFNLSGAFVVALNTTVYQPWVHHQIYVSHYPRYYYQNVYRNNEARGFNENVRRPFYASNHVNNVPRQNTYAPTAQPRQPIAPQQRQVNQNRNLGRPVQVKSYMRERKVRQDKGKH